jgi:Flp pilus assembly pilin Flp
LAPGKKQSNQEVVLKERAHVEKELGASLVEYSLLVALISCVVLTSVRVVGASVKDTTMDAADQLKGSGGFEDG